MMKIVGIGEYAVSSCEEEVIKTYALGSCVALVLYNTKDKIAGMVHIALPDSKIDKENKYKSLPGYFANTAVPLIFKSVLGGYPGDTSNYKAAIFGGASSRNSEDIFNVGKRNLERIEEILGLYNIEYDKSYTSGYFSRTIEIEVCNGKVTIAEQPLMI